jgi:hypothetical protein
MVLGRSKTAAHGIPPMAAKWSAGVRTRVSTRSSFRKPPTLLGRPMRRSFRAASSSTCATGASSTIRRTLRIDTPASRATSSCECPARSRTCTSWRFSIAIIS